MRGELVEVGTTLLVDGLREGLGAPTPQVGEPTYAAKISPEELELHWGEPAEVLRRIVRLGNAYTTVEGKRLKVWAAAALDRTDLAPGQVDGVAVGTGTTAVELIEVQPEGKPRRSARDWANGVASAGHVVLGS